MPNLKGLDGRSLWMIGGIKTGRGNPKCSEKFPSFFHFVNHKSHTDYTGIEPVPLQ
jgi:hypothetical protein